MQAHRGLCVYACTCVFVCVCVCVCVSHSLALQFFFFLKRVTDEIMSLMEGGRRRPLGSLSGELALRWPFLRVSASCVSSGVGVG